MFPQGDSEIVNEDRAVGLMRRFADSFRQAVPATFQEQGESIAQEFEDEMKFKLGAQLFHVPALSRAYYFWKLRRRLDPRTLIQTGEYLEGITHEQLDDEQGAIAFRVGVRAGLHQSSGMSLRALQTLLEYGTDTIPARPHWRPMIIQYQARSYEFGRSIRDRLARRVYSDLQS